MAILLGILIPSAVVIAVLVLFWLVRRLQHWRTYSNRGYNQVQHDLDEEEIEFKRILDSKNDFNYEYEDDEESRVEDFEKLIKSRGKSKQPNSFKDKKLQNSSAAKESNRTSSQKNPIRGVEEEEEDFDFEFSAKERDRLSLLEKFRSNLVAEADHHSTKAVAPTEAANKATYLSLGEDLEEDTSKEKVISTGPTTDDIQNHHPDLKAAFEELNQFYSNSDDETDLKDS